MQRRTAGYDDFRELLAFRRQRRVFIDRMNVVADIKQRCTELALVVLQVIRRVLDEQPVSGKQRDRRQFRQKQRLAALNLVDA